MSQLLSDVRAGGGIITAVNGGNNITVNTVAGVATVNVSGTTNHAVQVGNALGALTSIGTGLAGDLLTSNGPGADPSFQTYAPPPVGPIVYGQVYNLGNQDVLAGTFITFDTNGLLANIAHVAGSDTITINSSGLYLVTFWFDAEGNDCNFELWVNGVPNANGRFQGNSSAWSLGSTIVPLSAGDTIQFLNTGPLDCALLVDAPLINANVTITKITTTGATPGGATIFNGNTGSANPLLGVINLVTANSTFKTAAAGNTVTLDFFQSNSNIGADLTAITTGVRNTGYGAGVNQSLTSGTDNTTVGYGAAVNATTASQNIAIGTQVLNANVVSDDNVGIGFQALTLCTGSFENIAIGTRSLASLTNGDSNVAVGYLSMLTNSSGSDNVAIGSGALGNATNDLNVAVGFQSGINATTNSSCIYIGNAGVATENNVIRIGTDGAGAGQQNTTVIAGDVSSVRSFTAIAGNITAALGDVVITSGNLQITTAANGAGTKGYITYTGSGAANRFIHAYGTQNFFAGFQAGNNTLTTLSAIGNTGVGFQALEGLTTGAANTALGQSALTALQTGTHHVAIGLDALDSLLGGTDNVVVGDSSGTAYNTTESNNIILGANITGTVGEDNKMRLGNASTNQTYITGIFGNAPAAAQMAIVNASGQMGSQAIPSGTVSTLTGDTGGALSPTAGNFNIITNVAANNSGSSFSVAGSASTLTINVTDGRANTLLGFGAGNASLTSNNNVGLGYGALHSLGVNGNSNTAVGFQAFTGLTTGFDSVAIGNQAGVSISTGVQNTLVGASAGLNLTTSASNNTLIGNAAGSNYNSTESNNICLGQGVTGTLGESNKIRIGNASNNACFITGIDGVNVGSTAKVVTEGSNQLGTATITAGTGVSIGTSANTITINALGGGLSWSVITANQTAAVNNGYFCNKAGTLTLALPAASAVGDVIEVVNINTATGVQFTQAAGQQIFLSTASTTLGATGTLTSSAIGDSIKLVCRTANTTWWASNGLIGNWTPA